MFHSSDQATRSYVGALPSQGLASVSGATRSSHVTSPDCNGCGKFRNSGSKPGGGRGKLWRLSGLRYKGQMRKKTRKVCVASSSSACDSSVHWIKHVSTSVK